MISKTETEERTTAKQGKGKHEADESNQSSSTRRNRANEEQGTELQHQGKGKAILKLSNLKANESKK